jgi:hypothetical protein
MMVMSGGQKRLIVAAIAGLLILVGVLMLSLS